MTLEPTSRKTFDSSFSGSPHVLQAPFVCRSLNYLALSSASLYYRVLSSVSPCTPAAFAMPGQVEEDGVGTWLGAHAMRGERGIMNYETWPDRSVRFLDSIEGESHPGLAPAMARQEVAKGACVESTPIWCLFLVFNTNMRNRKRYFTKCVNSKYKK